MLNLLASVDSHIGRRVGDDLDIELPYHWNSCTQGRGPAGPAFGRRLQPDILQARSPPGRHQTDCVEETLPESSAR